MFKLLSKIDKKDIPLIFVDIIVVFLMVLLELKIPEYMSEITSIIGTTRILNDIIMVGFKMLLCAVLSALCSVVVGYLSARISANFSYRLRGLVFNKVQSFSMAEIKKFSTASLITRSTNDITQMQMIISMGLQLLVKSPIMAVWAICKIMSKSWLWSGATFVAVILISIVLMVIVFVAVPRFKKIQSLNDNLNMVSRENLTGVRVVRAFNAEEFEENKFNSANINLTSNQLFINKIMSLIDPTMNFIMSALPLSIYIIGAILISNEMAFIGKLDIFSNMVVFSSYAIQVVMSFIMLVLVFMNLPRASVSASRINEILSTQSSIVDGCGAEISENKGVVEFRNVAFKYPDAEEYVLKDINLKVNQGETVAFIGSTGSGKSTLINLVSRIYDATEGEVLVDGVNVKNYKLYDLNSKLGLIPQKPILFSGTINSNLTLGESFGEKPGEESVEKALQISMSNFVNELDDSKYYIVNQGGKNFSGGQKQRLSIAMAIARNPEILIFDDSFSALDYKTDKALRKALKKELNDTTCLIVAQRIGTIMDSDKIYVLDNGQIVGEGSHKELLKSCDVYKEIALSQLSKEEL